MLTIITEMKLFQVKILCSSRSTLFARLSILTFDVKTDTPMNLTQRNLVALCAPMNFSLNQSMNIRLEKQQFLYQLILVA